MLPDSHPDLADAGHLETDEARQPPGEPAHRRPGRPRGLGRVPGSGRKRGTANAITTDLKALIGHRPVQFLLNVLEGRRVRVGPLAGPGKPTYAYPTFQERMKAAIELVNKVVPDLKSAEIDVTSVSVCDTTVHDFTPLETARRIAWLLGRGADEADGGHRFEPPQVAQQPEPADQRDDPAPDRAAAASERPDRAPEYAAYPDNAAAQVRRTERTLIERALRMGEQAAAAAADPEPPDWARPHPPARQTDSAGELIEVIGGLIEIRRAGASSLRLVRSADHMEMETAGDLARARMRAAHLIRTGHGTASSHAGD